MRMMVILRQELIFYKLNQVEEHNEIIPSSFHFLDSQHLEEMDPVVQSSVIKSSQELSDSFDFDEAPLVEWRKTPISQMQILLLTLM